MNDEIDYEIIDGCCSYCGRVADYMEDSLGNGRLYCESCDNYNDNLELENEMIIAFGEGNNHFDLYL